MLGLFVTRAGLELRDRRFYALICELLSASRPVQRADFERHQRVDPLGLYDTVVERE